MNLRYAIVGTGAIGGYYGGRLANAGKEVHFLFNTEYEYVKNNGLKVDSVVGNFVVNPINAYKSATDMPKCDVVLVTLKSTRNNLLKQILPPLLHNDTVIVLIQNGLGLEAQLAVDFPNHTIAGGMAFICSSRIGVGHINHADYGALNVGFYQLPKITVLQQISLDFEQAKVPFTIAENLNEARWRKLVWNIPYNGLTVALNTSTDKLMQNADTRVLITDLMNEVLAGAAACGEKIEPEFVGKMLSMTDVMKPYAPSMKLDFDNHRPLEIQAIYANPIATAKAVGYYMRKTEMLAQELKFLDSVGRGDYQS